MSKGVESQSEYVKVEGVGWVPAAQVDEARAKAKAKKAVKPISDEPEYVKVNGQWVLKGEEAATAKPAAKRLPVKAEEPEYVKVNGQWVLKSSFGPSTAPSPSPNLTIPKAPAPPPAPKAPPATPATARPINGPTPMTQRSRLTDGLESPATGTGAVPPTEQSLESLMSQLELKVMHALSESACHSSSARSSQMSQLIVCLSTLLARDLRVAMGDH